MPAIVNIVRRTGGRTTNSDVPVNCYFDTNLDDYIDTTDILEIANYLDLYGNQPTNPSNS